MIYLIWAILNLVLGLGVLYIFYKAAKAINRKFGVGATVLFIMVVSSLSSFNSVTAISKDWTFQTNDEVKYFQQEYSADLITTPIFKIRLKLIAAQDKDRHQQEPLNAFSALSGVSGYNSWEPETMTIETLPDRFSYKISGYLDWKLLNYVIYREQRFIKGDIKKV